MRRDLISDSASDDQSEIDFVEQYWTQVWVRQGGPQGAFDQIPRKAEFKIMEPYVTTLPSGAMLLDGGCGLGDWTLYFSNQGMPTIGLDISRKTVDLLKQRFPNADFQVGDIRATELADDSIDGYFSWGTFEHFENGLDECIAEANRILKPGGYLFITVPYDNLRQAFLSSIGRRDKADGASRFYQWRLSKAELRQDLVNGGFEVLETRAIHKRQGVLRSLHHELGLPYEWLLTKGLSALLSPVLPSGIFAHMIMAVARKPQ